MCETRSEIYSASNHCHLVMEILVQDEPTELAVVVTVSTTVTEEVSVTEAGITDVTSTQVAITEVAVA